MKMIVALALSFLPLASAHAAGIDAECRLLTLTSEVRTVRPNLRELELTYPILNATFDCGRSFLLKGGNTVTGFSQTFAMSAQGLLESVRENKAPAKMLLQDGGFTLSVVSINGANTTESPDKEAGRLLETNTQFTEDASLYAEMSALLDAKGVKKIEYVSERKDGLKVQSFHRSLRFVSLDKSAVVEITENGPFYKSSGLRPASAGANIAFLQTPEEFAKGNREHALSETDSKNLRELVGSYFEVSKQDGVYSYNDYVIDCRAERCRLTMARD